MEFEHELFWFITHVVTCVCKESIINRYKKEDRVLSLLKNELEVNKNIKSKKGK